MPAIKLKKKTAEYIAEKAVEQSKASVAVPKEVVPVRESHSPAKNKEKPKPSFLQAEVLHEKRKRTVPPTELKLQAWLSENFEKKENVYISTPVMYEYYTESCLLESSNVVDVPHFNRVIRENLGKTFGLTETSGYKGSIKERKKLKPRVKAESLSLKMKDIIGEALKEAGNSKKGVRFVWIKNYIATKYPALRVDLQPKKLKSALERGMRYGHIELVKGIGQCGYYRDPNNESTKEEEDQVKVEKSQKKEKLKKENKDDDKTNGTTDDVEEKEEGDKKGKSRKRKRKTESEPESDKEGESGANEAADAKKAKKRKRGKSKRKGTGKKLQRDPLKHRIEDTFALAITYMSEPKEASVTKIKQYITNHYSSVNVDLRLKKGLEKGVERGLWEQVRGTHGTSGTYRLVAGEINPTYSESLEDMISQAILAAHEPKQASANLIKKYVVEYHSSFGIDNRPHLFRHALERASNKHKIRQLSGIGATGTFQLMDSFSPSPAILAGVSEEEKEKNRDISEDEGDRYVVRKTKSRSGRIPVTVISKKR